MTAQDKYKAPGRAGRRRRWRRLAQKPHDFARQQCSMPTCASERQLSNDELLDALAKTLRADAQLRANGALPAEAAAPWMKNKSFKQLGTPTVDAEELAKIKETALDKLRESATAAALGTDEQTAQQYCAGPPADSYPFGYVTVSIIW
eukprot:1104621-Pleurochrysis_carterae.AAC.1